MPQTAEEIFYRREEIKQGIRTPDGSLTEKGMKYYGIKPKTTRRKRSTKTTEDQ